MGIRDLVQWHQLPSTQLQRHPFSLQSEMNKLFDDFFNDNAAAQLWKETPLSLSIDVIENEKAFKIKAELPGIDAKDVSVDISDNYLTIQGEKKAEKETKDDNLVRQERSYGSFKRSFSLPETANSSQASAIFKNGVLTISIPKRQESVKNTRKLTIKNED